MDKLTLEQLKAMKPGVFAKGIVENSPKGIYMTDSRIGENLCWVAKRGGYHDWTIYLAWEEQGYGFALRQGQKITNEANIKKLVSCTDEAFSYYRM